ncbi:MULTISPECIES: hypothetical protein [unclassified Rhizobium]|uniref:hypothetical protein n=1 Tax=unclassified Rhizobium TaxID=2613769 RepID=UPI00161DE907|nr:MULTISPECIES: hypothetical protein [unclassified Rhizobium]MBB3318146.1 hypothetical protein [Rhizobium sp. BK181]MBB3544774.1 hypothetical protein [Rhizobium sp. BK399]
MKATKRTTYLNRVESDYFSRKWYRRSVTLFCNLLFTGKWMRKTQIVRCLVMEISEGGATVRIGKSQIPDHLYLVFGRFDVLVGSIVVERDPGVLHLCFVKELRPDFVNRLARMNSSFSTLESLSPRTISVSENVLPMLRPMPAPPYDGEERGFGYPTKHSKRP